MNAAAAKSETCPHHDGVKEKVNNMEKAINRQYALIFTMLIALISAFLYMSNTNSIANEAAKIAVRDVEKATNRRLTSCMESINAKIANLLTATTLQAEKTEVLGKQIYEVSHKQEVILEKITRQDERLAKGRGVER